MLNPERLVYPVKIVFINVRFWSGRQYLKDSQAYTYAMRENPQLFLRQIYPLNNGYVYIQSFGDKVKFSTLAKEVPGLKELDLVLGEAI